MAIDGGGMRTIVVTGATGLVGSHLLPRLTKDHKVHAISRSATVPEVENVEWHLADLDGTVDYSTLPDRTDGIVYLAQSEAFREFPDKARAIFQVNTVQALGMLDYARRARASSFVYASSGGVYGTGAHEFSETERIAASGSLGFYLSTKICSEILLDNYTQFMSVVALRFFFVYGKNQKRSMFLPRIADNIRNGNAVVLRGHEGLRVNPVHVLDAVDAILAALTLKDSHKINIAGPEILSLRRISEIFGEMLGIEPLFCIEPECNDLSILGDIGAMTQLLGAPSRFPKQGFADVV